MHPSRELDRLDRLMRERGGLAPVPEPRPLHKMAERLTTATMKPATAVAR
jgi:hypothetical protein